MSRNFELLQSLAGHDILPSLDGVTAKPLDAADTPAGRREIERRLVDVSVDPEIHKLVQRLFFNAAATSVKAVAFSPVDRVEVHHMLCGRVAESLSEQVHDPVCLVDADLGAPSLHEYFGLANESGFMEALLDRKSITQFVRSIRGCQLALITAGQVTSGWKAAVTWEVMAECVLELRRQFTYLLIKTPPLTDFAVAVSLSRLTDGVVLIVEANSTRRDLAVRIKQELQQANIAILGAVLNNRTFPVPQALYSRLS